MHFLSKILYDRLESSRPFFFLLFSTNFLNLIKCIISKNSTFDSRKHPHNDRRTTTGKWWGRPPLFKVTFFLNSVGFILNFGVPLSIVCGYLKIHFHHRNVKFKYIYRFILSHLVIDNLIFYNLWILFMLLVTSHILPAFYETVFSRFFVTHTWKIMQNSNLFGNTFQ